MIRLLKMFMFCLPSGLFASTLGGGVATIPLLIGSNGLDRPILAAALVAFVGVSSGIAYANPLGGLVALACGQYRGTGPIGRPPGWA